MDVADDYSTVVTGSGTKILRMMLDDKMPETSTNSFIVAGSINSQARSSPFDIVSFLNTCSSPGPIMSTQLQPQGTATTEPGLRASGEPVSCHGNIFTTSFNTQQSSAFLPLDSSASITNGQIIRYDEPIDSSENQSLLSDISFAMDTTLSQPIESYDLNNLSVYTTAQPTVMSHNSPLSASHSYIPHSDLPKTLKQEIYNTEEDSLTGMLNIDLMDVNSVLTFLDQDPLSSVSCHNQSIASS